MRIAFPPLLPRMRQKLQQVLEKTAQRPLPARALAWLQARRRPRLTVIYVNRKRLVRLDLDRKGVAVYRTVESGCRGPDALASVLPRALSGAPRPARKLWVLYDGLAYYTLSLPSGQIAGLELGMLRQAIQFELEQVMGVSTLNKELAFALLNEEDGISHYVVALGPQNFFDKVHKAAKKAGCLLAGIAHAGAFPSRLTEIAPETAGQPEEVGDEDADQDEIDALALVVPWSRLELWPELAIGISGSGARVQTIESFRRQEADLARWLRAQGASGPDELLIAEGGEPPQSPGRAQFDLRGTEALEQWLARWARAIAGKQLDGVALFAPGITPEREMMLSAGLAAAVLAVALGHYGWYGFQNMRLTEEKKQLASVEQQLKTLRDTTAKSREKQAQLQKTVDALKKQHLPLEQVLALLRTRSTRLLDMLAHYSGDEVVIEDIHGEKDDIVLQGVALRPSEANRLYDALERNLKNESLSAAPPEKKELKLLDGGGPWEFVIRLTDGGLAGFTLQAEGDKKGVTEEKKP
jgi:hypothetical protein